MFTVDAKVVNTSLVERDIPSLVTTEDNMLISIPSQEEIFGVVKSMDSLSLQVPSADTVSQLRPIALANFVFKIITKILANRVWAYCIAHYFS
ncbi:unnamed protein product [Prunus armeniaca]